ncbi:MAG: tetratricopeptide repeat protein [Limnospira sp.]
MSSQTPEFLALQLHQQAILKLHNRDWDGAIAACQKALELRPDWAVPCKTLGVAFQFRGQLPEAKQWYQKAVELQPEFAEAHANLGSVYAKERRWEAAIEAYQTALEINSNLAGVYRNLAKVWMEIERPDRAIECQYRVLQLEPNSGNAGDYLELGNQFFKQQKLDRAIACYENAIALEPALFQAHHNLGEVFNTRGQSDRAIACYENAIVANPTSKTTYRCLEKTLIERGEWERLVDVYNRELRADPDCFETHRNLGSILIKMERYERGIEAYLKAIEIKPNFYWSYWNLWEILARHKQLQRAIAILEAAVHRLPDSHQVELNLGEALSRDGQMPAAIAAYRNSSYKNMSRSHPEIVRKYWDKSRPLSPHFIIIGTQKGGTTSLYRYLEKHPQIVGCIKKETHFWNLHFRRGLDWYLSHFPHLAPEADIRTGEATPNYLEIPEVPHRLFRAFPRVKLIVLLRNPIHRAVSQYHHWVRLMQESRTLEEAMTSELNTLKNCSKQEIAKSPSPRYIQRGLYLYFLQNWLSVFPRSQFLILPSEDFYQNPRETFARVLDFLELPPCQLAEYSRHNRGHYTQTETEIYSQLRDYFRPHNRGLQDFLNLELNWDRDPG